MTTKIDYSKGLHDKANVDLFKRPELLIDLCNDLLATGESTLTNLSMIIAKTESLVQIRVDQKYFDQLSRADTIGPAEGECRLERALWVNWRLHPKNTPTVFHPTAPFLMAYQVPLFNKKQRESWGSIDLVGVSNVKLPVIIELKQEANVESPLRMLLEAVTYGISVRKAWVPQFRQCWLNALNALKVDPAPVLPQNLTQCQLLCLAPQDYWSQWSNSPRKIDSKGWAALSRLVKELETKHNLVAEFAQLQLNIKTWELPDENKTQ